MKLKVKLTQQSSILWICMKTLTHVHHKNCACIGRLLHITLMLQTFQSLPESDAFAMVKYNFMAHGSYEPPHWYRQFNDNTDVKKLNHPFHA